MRNAAGNSRRPFLRPLLSQASLTLMLGLMGFAAWAAAPSSTGSRAAEYFSQACSAPDAGDLDSAAQNLRALNMEHPDLPEARLLGLLLKLRREHPSPGGLDAFIQAWNDGSAGPAVRADCLLSPSPAVSGHVARRGFLARGALQPRGTPSARSHAALPDWRETDFHTLFHHALGQLRAAHHSQPAHAAFTFAVSAVASRPACLLFKRAEASREMLSTARLHRLGEALWRIGSRMAEESTILEWLLGIRLMAEGAELIGDGARAQRVSQMRETAHQAAEAMRQAAPERWPLLSLHAAHMEAKLRDEMSCMLRFLPPTTISPSMP